MVYEWNGTVINVYLSGWMPEGMPEHLIQNADGSYTVLLNARLSRAMQEEGFAHAIRHIEAGDFDKEDVQQIEAAAHNILRDNPLFAYMYGYKTIVRMKSRITAFQKQRKLFLRCF